MENRAARRRRWEDLALRLRERNLVMGILNITSDSFSDGGRYLEKEAALDRAEALIVEGADLIDIGGESTRPGADPVSPELQIRRVAPVIEGLRAVSEIPISVDTQSESVAAAALEAGADIVNDISALESSPRLGEIVAEEDAGLILMHKRGTPKTMQSDTSYADLVGEVKGYLYERTQIAVSAGVDSGRLWIDPGIGFGKSAEGNLEIIGRMGEFDSLGYPVVVGASRKSFLGKILEREVQDRLAGTLAVTCQVALSGRPRIHRVHDVRETRDALRILEAIQGLSAHV